MLSDILQGDPALSQRAARIPVQEQTVPIVVVEEILRGRLNSIRQAEAGKGRLTVERAYELFEATVNTFRHNIILPYTSQAETLYQLVAQSEDSPQHSRLANRSDLYCAFGEVDFAKSAGLRGCARTADRILDLMGGVARLDRFPG